MIGLLYIFILHPARRFFINKHQQWRCKAAEFIPMIGVYGPRAMAVFYDVMDTCYFCSLIRSTD